MKQFKKSQLIAVCTCLLALQAGLAACSVKVGSGDLGETSLGDTSGNSAPTELEGMWVGPCEMLPAGGSAVSQLTFQGSKHESHRIAYSDNRCENEVSRVSTDASFALGDESIAVRGAREILLASNQGLIQTLVLRKNDRLYLANDSRGGIDEDTAFTRQTENSGVGVSASSCGDFSATYAMNDELFTVTQIDCKTLNINATANPFTRSPSRDEQYNLDGVERMNVHNGTYERAALEQAGFVIERRRGSEVRREAYQITNKPCGREYAQSDLFLEMRVTVDGVVPTSNACKKWSKLKSQV